MLAARRGDRIAPAGKPVRTQIDQVGALAPAVDPADRRALHVQPADSRHIDLRFACVQARQRAEDHVPATQLEAKLALGLDRFLGRRPVHGVDPAELEFKRRDKARRLPAQRRPAGPMSARSPAANPPSSRLSTAGGGFSAALAAAGREKHQQKRRQRDPRCDQPIARSSSVWYLMSMEA